MYYEMPEPALPQVSLAYVLVVSFGHVQVSFGYVL
jgi:hypothetical protein